MSTPNILYIMCHDLGDYLGCYGHPTVATPNLDRLAAQGARLANNFCVSPTCSPSRAAMFTGRYPHAVGMLGLIHNGGEFTLHDDEAHLAQYLRDAGYQTALIGDQHVHQAGGERLGFQLEDPGKKEKNQPISRLADKTISYLSTVDTAERPFFIQMGIFEPHRPWSFGGVQPDDELGIEIPPFLPDCEAVRRELAAFQGAVKELDTQLGRILDYLDQTPHADNTLVIFTTDHGPDFPRAKSTLFDPGLRTAFVMRWAPWGACGGKVYTPMIANVDVLPTLLEGLGLPVPQRLHGQSFLPMLQDDPSYQPRTEIYGTKTFHGVYDPKRCVRTERFKYIINFELYLRCELTDSESFRKGCYGKAYEGRQPMFELYDLQADPLEMENLSGQPAYREIERELDGTLRDFMRWSEDPLLDGPIASGWYRRATKPRFADVGTAG